MTIDTLSDAQSSSPIAGVQTALSPDQRARLASLLERAEPGILERWYDNQFDEAFLREFEIAGADHIEKSTVSGFFLTPLFKLLVAYLRTGDPDYRDVYLDERLRYAPHSSERAVRAAFFARSIPLDHKAIVEESAAGPELAAELNEFLAGVHEPLLAPNAPNSVRLLALGDCLMNEVRVFLPSRCREAGMSLDMRMLYFSAAMGKGLATQEALAFLLSNPTDLIALSFLTYEGVPPYPLLLREATQLSQSQIEDRVTAIVGLMRRFMEELRERTEVPFLVHNASGLPLTGWRRYVPGLPPLSRAQQRVIDTLNRFIGELAQNVPNTLLIDENSAAARWGYRESMKAVVPQDIARNSFFHTSRFGKYLAEPYAEIIESYQTLRKTKVLLIDFDDTLWKGVMADGQVQHHKDRQDLLRRLKDAGILLVAISKNDPRNLRWDETVLQPSDFALLKINWNPKAQSIKEIAQQLKLGIDSFVLVDDNPTERELIHSQFPQIPVFDPNVPATWASLERLLSFPNTRNTEEARARTEMYRAQAKRKEALSQAVDYPAMMASLQLEAQFGPAHASDLSRVAELIQRTNQFNTTTIRYSRAQLQDFVASETHRVYVAELSDKYSRLGLVAVAIVERRGTDAIFDSFILSCRAMGFGFERLMLRLVLDEEAHAQRFIGKFVPTDRNLPASQVFAETGFKKANETESVLERTDPRPEAPPWFKVLKRQP